MTDNEWLMLMKKSPQKAHFALINEYGNLVYAIVLNKLKGNASREEIEDCVSDVFVEIFRSTDKFIESRGSLKGFLSTIAKNIAVNTYKRIIYQHRITSPIEDKEIDLPFSDESNPEEETNIKLLHERLWDIVYSLGEPDTSIIVYQYFYELKVNEIAKKLSMTSAAVQKRSIRARKHIKKILESEKYL